MSLEECKRIADERLKKARARAEKQYSDRRAGGWVDDGRVEIALYTINQAWIVAVYSHKHYSTSKKEFPRKEPAENYFEDLVQKYGLKEEK